jgi:histidine ammonia-lyase
MERTIEIDGQSLTVEQVARVAARDAVVELAAPARSRMEATRKVVDGIVARNDVVYGVTTGFGKLSEIAIPPDRLAELQVNLERSHAAGVGALLP